jgi:hypothetical protein
MSHSVFTVVAVIDPHRLESLRKVLDTIGSDPAANPYLPFGQVGGLHFASFVIFECPDALKHVPRFKDPILVFENNIDGEGRTSQKTYLAQLIASGPGIDDVYEHCVDYPGRGASPESKVQYLLKRVRKAQLYHVGTPYRTVGSIKEDAEGRRRWDRALEELMRPSLPAQLLTPAAGTEERWIWERLRQRIKWAGFGLIAGLIVRGLWRHTVSVSRLSADLGLLAPLLPHWLSRSYPHWPALLVFLLFAGSLAFFAMADSRIRDPERLRIPQWMPLAIAAFVLGIAVQASWEVRRPLALLLLLTPIPACLWLAALGDMSYNRRERLEELGTAGEVMSPASVLSRLHRLTRQALDRPHGVGDGKPPLWRRLWNWKWWAIAWLGVWIFILVVRRLTVTGHDDRLAELVAGLFLIKAWWLSALSGWSPLNPLKPKWHPKIFGFIVLAPVAGDFVTRLILLFEWSPWWMAAAVLGGLLLLWAVPLPSPPDLSEPRSAASLAALRDQEDLDVQNHMAAMVVLRQGLLRPTLLKVFLWTLNSLFFRAVLPDVFRGKLFGLPTVQFCQWVLLDSRRYLFLSNYDHSWTRYLDDFGLQLTTGIQKIWGEGQGNPGTSNLDGFKDFARTTMVPHSVWYKAYPGLSLVQIWNNEQIRRRFRQSGDDESAVVLLRRFAAGPRIQNAFSK